MDISLIAICFEQYLTSARQKAHRYPQQTHEVLKSTAWSIKSIKGKIK